MLMAITMFPLSAFAEDREIISSGNCGADGANLTYTLYSDGELFISGNGKMNDYNASISNYKENSPWSVQRASIKNVIIADGVSSIGNNAFNSCVWLESVSIPDGVESIGESAFYYCYRLINITLPYSIKNISAGAFEACSSLAYINLPDGVTSIGKTAFSGCKNITDITIPKSIKTISARAFEYCYSLTNITIPDGVTSIGDSAFYSCKNLTNITISDDVLSIGDNAFNGCKSLTNITIPDNVTSIGSGAFGGCTNLINITIPDGVTRINSSVFSGCLNLVSIDIPDNITYIGDNAFNSCQKLEYIRIPNGVKWINYATFQGCYNLKNVIVPESVTAIDDYAFDECNSLEKISIPDNVTNIGFAAFRSCDNLESVTIGNGVKEINNYTFYKCNKLSNVTLSDSITTIEAWAFYNCSNLTDVYYLGNREQWKKISICDYNSPLSYVRIHFGDSAIVDNYFIPAEKNDIVISVRDAAKTPHSNNFLENAKCTFGSNETVNSSENKDFIISHEDNAQQVVISCEDYYDYIIPEEVIASWKSTENFETKNSKPSYIHTAMLNENNNGGQPFISTVFARKENDEFKNIIQEELKVYRNYYYDIIISAVNTEGIDCTYFIIQDENHKISNQTGIFTNEELYSVLDMNKDCYAFIITSDGGNSDYFPVKFEKQPATNLEALENLSEGKTFNLLGDGIVGTSFNSESPILGSAELNLEAYKFPAGFQISDDRIKISIGLNLFDLSKENSPDNPGKYSEWSSETFKNWKDYCNNTLTTDIEKSLEEFDKLRENFEYTEFGIISPPKKSKDFNVNVFGYIDATFINGELVITDACINVAGEFKFEYTQQGAIWIIPAYVYIEAGAGLEGSARGAKYVADNSMPFNFEELSITLKPDIKGGAGLGVNDIVSSGLWAEATLPITFNFKKNHLNIDLNGSIGLEAEFFTLKQDYVIVDDTLNLVDEYFNTQRTEKAISVKKIKSAMLHENSVSVIDREYLENTSPWMGMASTYRLKNIEQNGLSLTPLQTSVFNQAASQVVAFGDKMLMAWVEDDISRDIYNRMRLMYSIYENGIWSEPIAVADDGKNDTMPVITTDGTNVYFAWQKMKEVITEKTATIEYFVENTEIYTAKYDASENRVVEVKNVSDNSCYDYAQSIAIVNGKAVCYWASCQDNQMIISSDNSIYRFESGNKVAEVKSGLNYILSIAGSSVNGKENISFSMDADGDTTTTDDVTIYTLVDNTLTPFDKGHNNVAYTYAFYGELDGRQTLFTTDMRNVYYIQDGETKSVINGNGMLSGNFNYVVKNGVPTLFWTENEETGNAVYSSAYENEEWTKPVRLSNTGTQLSSVDIVVYNDEFRGVCTSSTIGYNETKEKNEIVQTDLCALKIDEVQDISVDGVYIDEQNIRIGKETEFNVYVTNNGTKKVNNVTFTISDNLCSEVTVTKSVNLASGDGCFINLPYTAPANYAKTTLNVTASCDEISDSNSENNTYSKEIGKAKLIFTESELIETNDKYLITAMVTNESDVSVENVVINTLFNDSEEVIESTTITEIGPRETYLIQTIVSENNIVFDEETGVARVCITAEENDNYITGAKICYIIVKPVENECEHVITQIINRIEPTCKDIGYEGDIQCILCEEIIGKGDEMPTTYHTLEVIFGKPATCTETGLTEGKKCSVCGEILVVQKEISAKGHDYKKVVTAPTCTEKGFTTYTCDCGLSFRDNYINPTGHTYSKEVIAPTCTEKGYTIYSCACGFSDRLDYVNATGHTYSKEVVAPTCTEKGYTIYSCACGFNDKLDYVNAKGHTAGAWVVKTPAKVGVKGLEQQKCTVCGAVVNERDIPALPDVSYMTGDANGDGKITAADARITLRISAKLEKIEDYNLPLSALDVTGDGKLTAADARKILRASAKLETL